MTIQELIGKRLRAVRVSLGLTQSGLAERTGLGDGTISRMERGVRGITLENLYRIAEALNVPLDSLLDLNKADDLPSPLLSPA